MLRALLIACTLLAATPASAGGGKKTEGAAAAPPYVDLAAVGVPVIEKGRVVNYVFVQARLHAGAGQDLAALKAKEPWYRDALVRAAHRQSFGMKDDWSRIDEPRMKAVLLAEARRISGAKAFSRVEITRQASRRRAGTARPQASAR